MKTQIVLLIVIAALLSSCSQSGSSSKEDTIQKPDVIKSSDDIIDTNLAERKDSIGIIEEILFDSLLISTNCSIYVNVFVERLKYSDEPDCFCRSSDISLTIKDQSKNTLYTIIKPENCDSWNYLTSSSIYLEGIGNVIAINESHSPSIGSDQGTVTILGQNSLGDIIPMTGTIRVQGLFNGNKMFKVHRNNKGADNDYYLETSNFFGWCGIDEGKFYHLNLNGKFDPNEVKLDSIPIYVSETNVVTVKELLQSPVGNEFKLFESMDTGSNYMKITISDDSEIHFYCIYERNNEEFIYLQIDGAKGYLKGLLKNIARLGFPPCG